MLTGNIPDHWSFLSIEAQKLGFCAAGVIAVDDVPELYFDKYRTWLASGSTGNMSYLHKNLSLRQNPNRLSGTDNSAERVMICVALPYGDGAVQHGVWKNIARNSRGRDYHKTIKNRLGTIIKSIVQHFPQAECRAFVDSAPVMERTWAAMAGIGTIGKSGMLIVKDVGPNVLLGEIICSGVSGCGPVELSCKPVESNFLDICGSCRLCIDACPVNALAGDGTMNAQRCLSYCTIEFKGDKLLESRERVSQIFGCDICTTVCPHTNNIKSELELPLHEDIADDLSQLVQMDAKELQTRLQGTAMHRTGSDAVLRNARAVLNNLKYKNRKIKDE